MHEFIRDRLQYIMKHATVIIQRMREVENTYEYAASDEGQLIFDSLIARLQALGENFKKINEIDGDFLSSQLDINPKPIIRFRDLASHHYERMDYQIIFEICNTEVPKILTIVEKYLSEAH